MITKSAIYIDVKNNKDNINNIIFNLCKYNLRETFNELLTDLETDEETKKELISEGNDENNIYKFIVDLRNYSKLDAHYAYFFEHLMDIGVGIPNNFEFTKTIVKKLHPDSISKLIPVTILDNLNKPGDSEEYKYTYEMLPYLLANRDMIEYIFVDPDAKSDKAVARDKIRINEDFLLDTLDRYITMKVDPSVYTNLMLYMCKYEGDKMATIEYCLDSIYKAGNCTLFTETMNVIKEFLTDNNKQSYYNDLLYMYLFKAIKDNSMKFSKACFSLGADPNYCGKSGMTPIEYIKTFDETKGAKRFVTVMTNFIKDLSGDKENE